jgi:hypothetical protein
MRTRSSRLLVCAAVAVAAGLGWSPAAHAAGLAASSAAQPASIPTLPAVTNAVKATTSGLTGPQAPVRAVVRTAPKPVRTAVGETLTVTHHVASVIPSTPRPTLPATKPAAVDRQHQSAAHATHRSAHRITSRASARSSPQSGGALASRDRASTKAVAPSPRPEPASPGGEPPLVPDAGPLGAGAGSAPLLLAFLAATLVLAVPSRGRRMLPARAEGLACALTLDLERPD